MPPRYVYWTILLEGKPTAFRAHTRDELLPTLRQLQVRHPDAVMLWFARGRLWQSPEEERAAMQARRTADRDRRGPGWRPGGEHRDPRERFKVPRDEKRRRFAAKLRRDREEPASGEPRSGDRPGPASTRPRPVGDRARPSGERPATGRPVRPERQRPEHAAWRPRGPRGPGAAGGRGREPGGGGGGRGGSGGGNRGGGGNRSGGGNRGGGGRGGGRGGGNGGRR